MNAACGALPSLQLPSPLPCGPALLRAAEGPAGDPAPGLRELEGEGELVEAARRGNEEAFEAIYRRHRDYVLRLAARFGVEGEEAHDILQEAFLIFFRKLPTFEARAKLTTYLYPTVRFLALKWHRRKKRLPALGEGGEEFCRLPAAAPLEGTARAVVDLVSGLPAEQREVLLLRFVDGMSIGEISLAMAIPEGTVKSRLHYALKALRRRGTA